MNRRRVYQVIEKAAENDTLSNIYDISIVVVVLLSLIPLAFKKETPLFHAIDLFAVTVFIMDYLLRWMTADYKMKATGIRAFLLYPFTPMALIDLLAILPSLNLLHSSFKVLRVFRLFRAMRVLRIFKVARYSKSFRIIGNVMRASKNSLTAVCILAGGYVLVSALIIFNVEPDSFETFFDAVYWATVSLTTVGYGDIYPVTTIGRIITMISSILGIAIVALPASIITAGYMKEIGHKEDV